MTQERTRIIYYGDNLEILRQHIPTESVDLVHLDPPFKSQQEYNVLFRTVRGEPAAAQVRAFSDTWKWGLEAKATYEQLLEDPHIPGRVSQMAQAFYQFLGPSEMLAYLVMMTPRLLELHRFEIRGQPKDEEGARALAERDRFQFQVWALSLIGAQPLDPNRPGADRGIDGYLPFQVGRERHERAIVQVKSGKVGVKEVRDLRGTLERERAPFAILITLEAPTREMTREATEAGFYSVLATGEQIPRLQVLTIGELLRGERPRVPTTQVSPMPPAPRLRRREGHQLPLAAGSSQEAREN